MSYAQIRMVHFSLITHLVHEYKQEDYQAKNKYYDNESMYPRLDESCRSAREPMDSS